MGRFWLRESSQVVIKGNFHSVIGAEAVGSSGDDSDFVVEALDGAVGDLFFGAKPVQNQRLMGAQHPGYLFHRFQTAPHGPEAPVVEKAAGPDYGLVLPEIGEGFLQIPGPCGGSLLPSRALSFCRARPRTRLPRRSKSQRICLSRWAAFLLLARRRELSARRT